MCQDNAQCQARGKGTLLGTAYQIFEWVLWGEELLNVASPSGFQAETEPGVLHEPVACPSPRRCDFARFLMWCLNFEI
eukprot:3035576-Rhodomonas_salina.1